MDVAGRGAVAGSGRRRPTRRARPHAAAGRRPRGRTAVLTLLAVVGLVLGPGAAALAAPTSPASVEPAPAVELVRFTGDGCPRCEEQSDWLEENAGRWPTLRVVVHEVWADPAGRAELVWRGDRLGFEASSVPTTVLGERVWIGWTGPIADDLAGALDLAAAGEPVPPGVYGRPGTATCDEEELACGPDEGTTIDVPLVGEVDLGGRSMLVSTLVIGFVDGVNPCSLWAISVLLTIVVRTASRRRVLAVGTTFLLVTAAMYALYMAGIYSALTVASNLGAIQVVVAVVAGVVGVVSVKDYFAFKRGISFTIKDSAKPGLYRRMRQVASHHRLAPALAATAVLAVGVSLLETPCTAGFPVLWTGMLQAQDVSSVEAAGLFGLYMVPFLLDEFLVFGVAVATMRATRMQETHGRLLKLVAGVTLLTLAATMVVAPAVMESPVGALLLFAAAFVLVGIIHAATSLVRRRRGLPAPDQVVEPVERTGARR